MKVHLFMIKNIFRAYRQQIFRRKVLQTNKLILTDKPILIIAPHPDDETFGCAGFIAKKIKNGANVTVAFLTYGENSMKEVTNKEVATNRKKTSHDVCDMLGVQDIHYCGLKDGKIPRRDSSNYKDALKTVMELVEKVKPQEVFCTHVSEGWSDHTATAELAEDALKKIDDDISLYYYWVWVWFSVPLKKINLLNFKDTYHLDIEDVIDKKKVAISKYLDSKNSDGKAYCGELPKLFLKAFEWHYEIFEKVEYK